MEFPDAMTKTTTITTRTVTSKTDISNSMTKRVIKTTTYTKAVPNTGCAISKIQYLRILCRNYIHFENAVHPFENLNKDYMQFP